MIGRGTPRTPLLSPQPLPATASTRPACSRASAFQAPAMGREAVGVRSRRCSRSLVWPMGTTVRRRWRIQAPAATGLRRMGSRTTTTRRTGRACRRRRRRSVAAAGSLVCMISRSLVMRNIILRGAGRRATSRRLSMRRNLGTGGDRESENMDRSIDEIDENCEELLLVYHLAGYRRWHFM